MVQTDYDDDDERPGPTGEPSIDGPWLPVARFLWDAGWDVRLVEILGHWALRMEFDRTVLWIGSAPEVRANPRCSLSRGCREPVLEGWRSVPDRQHPLTFIGTTLITPTELVSNATAGVLSLMSQAMAWRSPS